MAKTVTLSITTKAQDFPATTTFSGFKFTLRSAGGAAAQQIVQTLVAQFTSVPPGVYEASVEALDGNNNTIGAPVTVSVTVPADPVATIQVPDVINVTIE